MCKFNQDGPSNPTDCEGNNCTFSDKTAKIGISHRISRQILAQSSPAFQPTISRFDTLPECDTHTHTHTHTRIHILTHDDIIYHASIAPRGKKNTNYLEPVTLGLLAVGEKLADSLIVTALRRVRRNHGASIVHVWPQCKFPVYDHSGNVRVPCAKFGRK